MSIFEVREYQVNAGKMAEWVDFMESRVLPYITSKGMVVTAMFQGEEDENLHVWIRRFDNEAHREALYKAVYESEEWQSEIKPIVRSLVDIEKTIVHKVRATPLSPMR